MPPCRLSPSLDCPVSTKTHPGPFTHGHAFCTSFYPFHRGCIHPVPRSDLGTLETIQAAGLPSRGLWEPEPTGQVSTLSTLQEWDCLDQGIPWAVRAFRVAQSTRPQRNEPFRIFGFLFPKS